MSCARRAWLRSASLLVGSVAAAPAAVLAQLDAIRIVPLGLLRLIVAPLALLTLQGDGDSNVSASHGSCSIVAVGTRKNPAAARFPVKDSGGQIPGWRPWSRRSSARGSTPSSNFLAK